MALKSFRPLTPALRFKSLPAFDEITKGKPAKSLLEPKKRTGGRNNFGRLTSRHIGGGHKQHYRKVDFKRRKRDVAAEVVGIEYDPNRSARIALIKYADGELSYILSRKDCRWARGWSREMKSRRKSATRFRYVPFRSARTFTTLNFRPVAAARLRAARVNRRR